MLMLVLMLMLIRHFDGAQLDFVGQSKVAFGFRQVIAVNDLVEKQSMFAAVVVVRVERMLLDAALEGTHRLHLDHRRERILLDATC